MRCLTFARHILAEDARTKLGLHELLFIFQEVTNEIKAELKAEGREDDFAGLKVRSSVSKPFNLRLIPP